jgi:hypothetical protein
VEIFRFFMGLGLSRVALNHTDILRFNKVGRRGLEWRPNLSD